MPTPSRPASLTRPRKIYGARRRYYHNNNPDSNVQRVRTLQQNESPVSAVSIHDAPLHLPGYHGLPAAKTWFRHDPETSAVSFSEKLEAHAHTRLSYELMMSKSSLSYLRSFQEWLGHGNEEEVTLQPLVSYIIANARSDVSSFQQFEAPLEMMIRASKYNKTRTNPLECIKELYIAQSDIRDLPPALMEDLPTPDFVRQAGRGDIYGSSIWLGLQPTYTPLHADPNPNLFCQLVGSKAVRLMPPRSGSSTYARVRQTLGSAGSSRFRGTEMMDGPERDELHRVVWVAPEAAQELQHVVLEPGDSLFIPRRWWHSVTSVGDEAVINASANWWFR